MNNNLSNVEISVQELKLLVNTLTKSVALSLRKRYTWLGVIVGLLIGSCLTLAIISLTWKQTDKITEITQTLLEKNRDYGHDRRHTSCNKMSASTDVGKRKISATQDIIQPGRYTVYVHYTNKKNKKMMERLSVNLTHTGFKVEGIQKVNYHNQDIRYFHDEDKEGALVLKKHLTGFISPITSIKNTDIKIINLSRKYPNAQKGALELWLNF